MAGPLLYDRCLETSTTTGTGTLTLAGAVTGHQSFAAVGDGNTCPFCVYEVDADGNPDGDWEVSIGAYTASGTTLARTTVLASSNSGAAVNFGAGTKRVALVLPAAFLTQYAHPTNTFANLAAAQAGRVLFPSDGFSLYRDTGSALAPWGPLFPFTQPVDGDFAWINQGSATVTATNGGIIITDDFAGGTNLRIRKKAAPSVPYTITAAVLGNDVASGRLGLLFRQSSDGKLATLHISSSSSYGVQKFNSPTSFSASYSPAIADVFRGPVWWLRIADDNTDRICSASADGTNWITVFSVTRTDFLTADEVGFFVGGTGRSVSLLSWKEG